MDLAMSREEFVDFSILLGCDYTGKIPKIGKYSKFLINKSFKILTKNKNIYIFFAKYLIYNNILINEVDNTPKFIILDNIFINFQKLF
jgi:hypothetical protein